MLNGALLSKVPVSERETERTRGTASAAAQIELCLSFVFVCQSERKPLTLHYVRSRVCVFTTTTYETKEIQMKSVADFHFMKAM